MLIMNIRLKIWATFLPILVMAISVPPARAGRAEPIPVLCWFFRGDKVELKQTCIYESRSWAGGGVGTLRWEDSVQTKIYRGFQENGDKPCGENESIDGICAVRYFRHPVSLQRISAEEEAKNRLVNRQSSVICLQVRDKSICWLR
jgi:hypothetical protein